MRLRHNNFLAIVPCSRGTPHFFYFFFNIFVLKISNFILKLKFIGLNFLDHILYN